MTWFIIANVKGMPGRLVISSEHRTRLALNNRLMLGWVHSDASPGRSIILICSMDEILLCTVLASASVVKHDVGSNMSVWS